MAALKQRINKELQSSPVRYRSMSKYGEANLSSSLYLFVDVVFCKDDNRAVLPTFCLL